MIQLQTYLYQLGMYNVHTYKIQRYNRNFKRKYVLWQLVVHHKYETEIQDQDLGAQRQFYLA